MKIFSVDEANKLLPKIVPKLASIRTKHEAIGLLKSSVSAAAEGATHGGGGTEGGTKYVNALIEIGKLSTEIIDLGIQIKDYTRGLIDFPAMRDGRVILLCWQIGEDEKLEWWHEIEGGFSGRQRL